MSRTIQKKPIEQASDIEHERPKQNEKESQFQAIYNEIIQPIHIKKEEVYEALSRAGISYLPQSPYEGFKFEVEKAVPCFAFYRLHVRLAHFRLTLTVLRHRTNSPFAAEDGKAGGYGRIHFVRLSNREACLKSLPFCAGNSSQMIFERAVREFAILKICAAMGCAPRLDGALGFDIVAYDDCLQYAMERGRPFGNMNAEHREGLRSRLRLMHDFRIVHLDVKPENVVWSEHHQRAVFIDFGFSEVIREPLGFKTLSVFKGTPNYASPPMLALMAENFGRVDLYYNDAYALDLIIRLITKNNQSEGQSQEYFQPQSIKLEANVHATILSFTFQFNYLNEDLLNAVSSLQACLKKDKAVINKLLLFIKQVFRHVFLKELFTGYLKQFQSNSIYNEIKELMKVHAQAKFFKVYQHEFNQLNDFQDKLDTNQPSILLKNEQDYHNFLDIILDLKQLNRDTILNFLAIGFQCIRFDTKNLKVQQKSLIAKKLNQLLNKFNETKSLSSCKKDQHLQGQSEILNEIRTFLVSFLRLCLQSPPSNWVKQHIFDLFEQIILVNANYYQQIDKLHQYCLMHFSSFQQRILLVLMLSRLLSTASMVMHNQLQNISRIQQKLQALIQSQMENIITRYIEANNHEDLSIQNILRVLQINQSSGCSSEQINEQDIKLIRNPKIRNYLFYYNICKRMIYIFDSETTGEALKMSQIIKNSQQLRALDFFSYSRLNMELFSLTRNSNAQIALHRYIASVIDCDAILKTLNLDTFKHASDFNPEFIGSQVQKITRLYPYMSNFKLQECNRSILSIIRIIRTKAIKMTPKLKSQFIELYKVYEKQNLEHKFENLKYVKTYYNAFQSIQIQEFFYLLSHETQRLFRKHCKETKEQSQICRKLSVDQNSKEIVFVQFKAKIYLLCLYTSRKNWSKSLSIINQFLQFYLILKNNYLVFQTIGRIFDICKKIKDRQIIAQNLVKIYQVCISLNHISYYFQYSTSYLFINTLVLFSERRQKLFYEFCYKLASFLQQHPNDCFIQLTIYSFNQFLKYNPAYGHLLHFSKFTNNPIKSAKSNPYMLLFYVYSLNNQNEATQLQLFKAVALYCEEISQVTKKNLLFRYFSVYLSTIQGQKKRRKVFVLRQAKRYLKSQNLGKCIEKIYHIEEDIKFRSQIAYLWLKSKIKDIIIQFCK